MGDGSRNRTPLFGEGVFLFIDVGRFLGPAATWYDVEWTIDN